jgi:hypothetical protein
MVLLLLLSLQSTYVADRADAMQSIEATIVELGGIFQQLATVCLFGFFFWVFFFLLTCFHQSFHLNTQMIQEQGESLQRIDDNVSATVCLLVIRFLPGAHSFLPFSFFPFTHTHAHTPSGCV